MLNNDTKYLTNTPVHICYKWKMAISYSSKIVQIDEILGEKNVDIYKHKIVVEKLFKIWDY